MRHAKALVRVAQSQGIEVEPLFVSNANRKFDHEYQFLLETQERQLALQCLLDFLSRKLQRKKAAAIRIR